jgi:hypothetical protein
MEGLLLIFLALAIAVLKHFVFEDRCQQRRELISTDKILAPSVCSGGAFVCNPLAHNGYLTIGNTDFPLGVILLKIK